MGLNSVLFRATIKNTGRGRALSAWTGRGEEQFPFQGHRRDPKQGKCRGRLNQEGVKCFSLVRTFIFCSFMIWTIDFHYLLREKPSLLILSGWTSISIASPLIYSVLARILVSWNGMQWAMLMLCSATADSSGQLEANMWFTYNKPSFLFAGYATSKFVH